MIKNIKISFLLIVLLIAFCASCSSRSVAATDDQADISVIETEQTESIKVYDPNIDYMSLMISAAYDGNNELCSALIKSRNAKIEGEGIEGTILTVGSFYQSFESFAGFDLSTDYSEVMVQCAISGDIDGGREAAKSRNLKIETLKLHDAEIDFEDMYLLAKIITAEAGSDWLPIEWKMKVGEVVLNRVASPEFPNTIHGVVYQPGQYSPADKGYFRNFVPWEASVEAAMRLMQGERLINDPSVVFQSNGRQGSGVYEVLYDSYYGNTYLCYSNYPELYVSEGLNK